jgi:cytosine/creatinine deaminase
MTLPADFVLTDVRVPVSLLAAPDGFGGRVAGGWREGALVLRGGKVEGMATDALPDLPQVAGGGRIVLSGLTDPHVHLDKCHTAHRLPAIGGDLMAAIAAQACDKARWSAADIRTRAERGLSELVAAGCRQVRSHVDWGTPTDPAAMPTAWPVLRDLAYEWSDRIDLQLAALIDPVVLANPDAARPVAQQLAREGAALGVFLSQQPERAAAIAGAVALVGAFDLALDFHVDEGLAPGLNGLGLIADELLRRGHRGPVLCGHACSLINLSGSALAALLDKMARAGLAVVSLPTTNLYLQGRSPSTTPDRRGITRLHELSAAGVTVALGNDNVRDAFFPLGRHDALDVLALAVPALHLDPPFDRWLPLITTDAACAMGADPVTIDRARLSDLIVAEARDMADLLTAPARTRLSTLYPI